jgi:UDP-N-acetyl-D-glucosamine 2-epimerase, UDP-hydrolysing
MSHTVRKICIVVHSRANYGRIKSVMRAVQAHPDLELQLVIGASALLYRFGSVRDIIEKDGFLPNSTVYTVVEGETPATMAKSTGLGIIELASIFEQLRPDVVLSVADRFETMSTAIAASYMNIPLAHTQGGELTGSIDETVRHAITKLAHLHFPATRKAATLLRQMGEESERIIVTGCPAIDLVVESLRDRDISVLEQYGGTGGAIDFSAPYLVLLQHPVTTEYGQGYAQIKASLDAIRQFSMQTVILWPNADAGSDYISKGLRLYRERNPGIPLHFYRNFAPEDYVQLIKHCACQIGNSSSAIREGTYLGIPAVNVGSRQDCRERGSNVLDAPYDVDAIATAIRTQLDHGPYPANHLYGDGTAGTQIAAALATVPLSITKRFQEL